MLASLPPLRLLKKPPNSPKRPPALPPPAHDEDEEGDLPAAAAAAASASALMRASSARPLSLAYARRAAAPRKHDDAVSAAASDDAYGESDEDEEDGEESMSSRAPHLLLSVTGKSADTAWRRSVAGMWTSTSSLIQDRWCSSPSVDRVRSIAATRPDSSAATLCLSQSFSGVASCRVASCAVTGWGGVRGV